ncbi:MAG: SGNH/GDSL hydrolase family protein [Nocardiopsaceae bacterium]|nr:SGNH/GDSL hydrolase family protein [Nocardiopsaceae bacterium]
MTSQITSFVALGDSFTEGLDDARDDQQGFRGWADRLAEHLAADQPGLRYANLAVRGKLLRHVVEEQLPQAIAMSPDLVSIAAGGNDMLHLRIDPDELGRAFDEAVRTLLMAGCQVLMFTGFDPRFPFPVLRLIRGKISIYNMHLRAIADRHHCHTVDLWSMRVLRDKRAWSADRLHLTPDAHRRVALRAAEVLGVPVAEDWREPWPDDGVVLSGTRAWLTARNTDLRWAREHAAPWVGRQLRGVSTADGKQPKRPELAPLRITGHGLR